MWYPKERKIWALLALLGAASVIAAQPVSAAVLDVCPTCTHTTLDAAFTAAQPNDVIILDGPTLDSDPAVTYTLTTDLVINAAKDGLQIRGKTAARPDKIIVQGTGAGPVITAEQGFTFKAVGFTITGGSTGILAMKDSDVDIRRCLIQTIAGVGVDCTNPKKVYIAGSVITGCTSDAVRLDLGGELNMSQCTLLSNTGRGVNAIAGVATVASCLIHDSGTGLVGTGTSLTVGGNWVTDAAGAPLPMPTGVTDAFPITDVLDPLVTFETDTATNPFPGDIDDAFVLPLTGQPAATLSDVPMLPRDFSNVRRDSSDPRPGADENGIAVTTAAWIECEIVQRGQVRNWVGEGPLTIYVVVENEVLTGAKLWIANPTQSGIALDVNTPANRLGAFSVQTPSFVDENYGYVDYPISRTNFVTGFPNIADVDTTDYEVYIQPTSAPLLSDPNVLDGVDAAGSQAEVGRVFGLDTKPPKVVTDINLLADQYATAASVTDGGAIDPGPWAVGLPLLGTAGANAGYINLQPGDPSIFYDGPTPKPNMGIALTFTDEGSGFEVNGLPNGRSETTFAGKSAALYNDYENVPGMAWWDPNDESTVELLTSPASLTVTYTNTGGTELKTAWNFSGVEHDLVKQWHAIANVRVTDLAGNEATIDPSFRTFIPLKPIHMWWFPEARGELRRGPSGGKETNPVFTWGMFRGVGGQDPKDPLPCFSSVRWRLWGATAPGVPTTSWVDLTGGGWSDWMFPSVKTIGLDTLFNGTTRLRDLMTGPAGSEYLIAVQGYDEAGNLQIVPALGNLATVADLVDTVGGTYNIDFRRWIAPGVDESLGVDTRVQAHFWYNPGVGGRDRTLDAGERDFGSATRIPLPPGDSCQRIEAGFTVAMDFPATVLAANARVYYEVFEDGRRVADGFLDPNSVNPATDGPYHFAIPSDLMFGTGAVPPWLAPGDADTDDLFLNTVPLCSAVRERLGDDGPAGAEPPYRQRDVKYQILFATDIGGGIRDVTPATVEFTVTVDRALKDDQPVKSFSKE